MTRTVRKYEIAADEKPHSISLTGRVLFIDASRDLNELDVWVEVFDDKVNFSKKFRVFKDGQVIPDDALYVGTTGKTLDGSVWHLYEVFV